MKTLSILLLSVILVSCFCICGPSKLIEANFNHASIREMTYWQSSGIEISSEQIAFSVSLDDSLSLSFNNDNTEPLNVKLAGAMQPCECSSGISPDWDIVDIQAKTIYDLNQNFLANSNINELLVAKIIEPGAKRYDTRGVLPLQQLITASQEVEIIDWTNSGFALLSFDFILSDVKQKGLQQIEMTFTLRNGKTISALSPEFKVEEA